MSENKATEEKKEVKTETTPEGKVFNFTRHGFVVIAKNLKEAQKALEEFLKENKGDNK